MAARVAIIGSGVSGLGAAYRLAPTCDVTLFEAADWIGGHANTRQLKIDRTQAVLEVDTGFIVHNRRAYPELIQVFKELDVPTRESDMSMSVSCKECGLEFAGRRPLSILSSIARRPSRLKFYLEIWRFFRLAAQQVRAPQSELSDNQTLRDWAQAQGFSQHFQSHFLTPLMAAVWSTPPGEGLDMPARNILIFLNNHGMLSGRGIKWRTVVGGSREYVRRLVAFIESHDAAIHLNRPIHSVQRSDDGIELVDRDGVRESFDFVVIATHPDHALALLESPTDLEREALSPWRYTDNEVVLHTSPNGMPTMRSAWGSWNYSLADCSAKTGPPTLTYWMNCLQGLEGPVDAFVTMNGSEDLIAGTDQYRVAYRHPVYSVAAAQAQALLPSLLDAAVVSHTTFCGAWHGYGFHEDGMRAGLQAADRILDLVQARPAETQSV